MITQTLSELIKKALAELALPTIEYTIEHPADESHGDYATNVAMVLFGQLKKEGRGEYQSPRDLAQALIDKLQENLPEEVEKIELAGPGFINFYLSPTFFAKSLEEILIQKDKYGSSKVNSGQEIIVEYSSPNIAKPFTIGHLRSTIIGDAVANIKEATGWKVYRDNHAGDWGTQFGKQIYAIKTWANEADLDASINPVKDLVALYVQFHEEAEKDPSLEDKAREWFKKLEDGDAEAKRLWQKCIDWSWKEFDRIYAELNVRFTENNGRGYSESYFEGKMQPIIDELKDKNLLKESQEAQLVFFPEEEKMPPLMILKKDGATLYATRDLATDKFRLEKYGQDIVVINEVGAEQALYWRQIFRTEEMLGWYKPEQRTHIGHGMFRFKDQKMSTRKGNVIWLEDVLQEAKTRARTLSKNQNDDKVADQVAVGALKWNDLKRRPALDVLFDWDEVLNMEGNSGPYVQYAHARAMSVLEKSLINDFYFLIGKTLNTEEKSLANLLYQYPEIIVVASKENAPYHIANYLFDLSQRFNTFYNQHSILGSEKKPVTEEEKQFRLALTAATAQILKNGLALLGITAPEKM